MFNICFNHVSIDWEVDMKDEKNRYHVRGKAIVHSPEKINKFPEPDKGIKVVGRELCQRYHVVTKDKKVVKRDNSVYILVVSSGKQKNTRCNVKK